jgi:orotidine-5'-phosphate decarboxylase
MMRAAAEAAARAAAQAGRERPLVIAVTVLTSLDQEALEETGVDRPVLEQVVRLAKLTQDAGLDGVVASPQEIAAIRGACGSAFTVVTPGIRPGAGGPPKDDQARTMDAAAAMRAGASYLVVGRPITAAADPRAAALAIADSLP